MPRLHRAVIVNKFHKGAQTSNTLAVFVIFQPQGFIIKIITRIQINISSDCQLFNENYVNMQVVLYRFHREYNCVLCVKHK